MGKRAAILDADITGPSIPRMFGVNEPVYGNEYGMVPPMTDGGVKMMSINLILENSTDPVIWRGSLISGTVKQFWSEVCWGDVDCLYVDMPPGTGDVSLSVFQSIPLDGIIIVASPQELVSMVVEKAVKMAEMMEVPIVGLVENMSYLSCPDCGKKIHIFGEGRTDEAAARYDLEVLAKMPIDPSLAQLVDHGAIEAFEGDWLSSVADKLCE